MSARTIKEILEEIQEYQTSKDPRLIKHTPTSVLTMLNESISSQIRKVEIELYNAIDKLNIYTATGEDLDKLVKDRLPTGRYPGSPAHGEITFMRSTGGNSILIPQGTQVGAPTSTGIVYFETDENVELAAGETQVTVGITATIPGESGNVAPHTISYLPKPILGIESITNFTATSGGEDPETDDALRNRYIYAILEPGRATAPLVAEKVTSLLGALQCLVNTTAPGEAGIIVDAPDTLADIMSNTLMENVAAGVCCGRKFARIVNGTPQTQLLTSWGGKLWIRAGSVVTTAEQITGTALDQSDNPITFSVTIPAQTMPGDCIEATLSSNVYVTKITDITYGGSNSYDLLIGLGTYPYLWERPREVGVDIQITIKKAASFEGSLEWKIEQSVSNFVSRLKIGQDLEFADLVKAVFTNTLPPFNNFEGIDDIITCYAIGKGQMIGSFGTTLEIENDEKIMLSSISVESTN